jgi:hypothetical protein
MIFFFTQTFCFRKIICRLALVNCLLTWVRKKSLTALIGIQSRYYIFCVKSSLFRICLYFDVRRKCKIYNRKIDTQKNQTNKLLLFLFWLDEEVMCLLLLLQMVIISFNITLYTKYRNEMLNDHLLQGKQYFTKRN